MFCPSISTTARLQLQLDVWLNTEIWTLRRFFDEVLVKRLGFNSPSIHIGCSTIYEHGTESNTVLVANLDKLLKVRAGLIAF